MSRPVEAFLPGGLDGQQAQKLARFPLDLLHAPDPLPPQFTGLFRKAQENSEDVRAQGGFDFGNPAVRSAFSPRNPGRPVSSLRRPWRVRRRKIRGDTSNSICTSVSRSREPSPRTSFGPQIVSWHSRTGRRRTARNPHATSAGPTYAYKLLIIHELLVFAGRMRFLRKLAEPFKTNERDPVAWNRWPPSPD